jgi:hypothetical protein
VTDPAIPDWALALQQLENRTITGGVAAADGDMISSITLLLDDGSEVCFAVAAPSLVVTFGRQDGKG